MRKYLSIKLYDKNGSLFKVLDREANVDWSWRELGGCGQAKCKILGPYDYLQDLIQPQTSMKIFIADQLRYTGKLVDLARITSKGSEGVNLTFYGYTVALDDVIVKNLYEGQSASAIVSDIVQNYIAPNTDVIYDPDSIDAADYSVIKLDLNHTGKDAIKLLAELAGNFAWGVDRNKTFFFKRADNVVRNVFNIGNDVEKSTVSRKDEDVVNYVNMYGSSGGDILAVVQSSSSINKYGRKEKNMFESSISELSDANRLAQVRLKKLSNSQRRVKFSAVRDDIFLEENLPMGAIALDNGIIREKVVYSTSLHKYGRNIKYGNLTRNQAASLKYKISGGGMQIQVELKRQLPSVADQQKGIEFQIKNVQRR